MSRSSVKAAKSTKPFGAILVIVAVLGVSALGYVLTRPAKVITLPAVVNLAAAGVVTGSPDALVEVVEFADFECPGCGYFATLHEPDIMARLVASGEIRFRFMDYPLDVHPNALAAHNAAQCANEQGKFWEMHDRIFQNQERWNTQATPDPKKVLKQLAGDAGLDVGKWDDCYDSGSKLEQIAANRKEGERMQVRFTPSFVIGGKLISGSLTYDEMKTYVTAEKIRIMAEQSKATGSKVIAPVQAEKPKGD